MIRGKPRTKVRLKILRKTDKDDEFMELAIFRDQIKVEISDSDLNSLIDYVENNNDRDIITLGYSLISSVYLKKGDYKNSFIFLKKYINQLSNSTNKNISKSFALRHNLNIFQHT